MKYILKLIGLYFNALSLVAPKVSAKQALNLFGNPFKAKLNTTHQAFLQTGKMFIIEVAKNKVQYYSWGIGSQKILLVHGWRSNAYRWKAFINSIDQNKYTVYAFDAPGHGNSKGNFCTVPLYEQSINALITKIGYTEHFVGHSIGSFACASYMNHHNYALESYTSLASPYSALEFFNTYQQRLQLSQRSIKYLTCSFELYTSHPLEHYSHSVFSANIQANRILLIHDRADNDTPYSNALKQYNCLLKEKHQVYLLSTDGLKHSLRSHKVVEATINLADLV